MGIEFRVVWQLIEQYVHDTIKSCCYEWCDKPIKDVYHLWTNSTEVNFRVHCEREHTIWMKMPLQKLFLRYNIDDEYAMEEEIQVGTQGSGEHGAEA